MIYISSLASAPAPALRARLDTIIADALKSVPREPAIERSDLERHAMVARLERSFATLEGLALEDAARAVLDASGNFKVLAGGIRFPLPQRALRHAYSNEAPSQIDVRLGDDHAVSYCPDLIAINEYGELVMAEIKRDANHARTARLQDIMTRLKASAMVAESVLRQHDNAVEFSQAFVAIIDATGTSGHADVLDFDAFGEAIDEPDFARDMGYFRAAFDAAADTIRAEYRKVGQGPVRSSGRAQQFKVPLYAPFAIRTHARYFRTPLYAPFTTRTRAEPGAAVGGPRP